MTSVRLFTRAWIVLPIALTALSLSLCLAPNALALFSNGGFEAGNLTGWTTSTFLNPGLNGSPPFTGSDIVRDVGGDNLTRVLGPYTEMSQSDPSTGGVLHYPLSGSYCAVVNYEGNNQNGNTLTQTSTASSSDVQADGKVHVQFAWAAVVQNPDHTDTEQPYVYVAATDVTKGTVLYQSFIFAGNGSIWHTAANSVQYTDWQVLDIAPDSSALAVGDQVEIEVTAAGCALGGHWGYVYVDHFGSFQPVTPSVTVADKTYDGTTSATITGRSLSGVQNTDDVSLSGGTATFDTASPGLGKTVTVTGLTLSGADADKYMLTSYSATTTADIVAAPSVSTAALSGLGATSASSGGNVTSDGCSTVTARGVCWSTSANPTIADSHTTDGTGTGAFTSSITGLTNNTTYHVRAYATNAVGTSYGPDVYATTLCSVSFASDGTTGATLTGDTSQSVASGGDATAVTANAPTGHYFINWALSNGSSSTDNPLTLTSVEGNLVATATFGVDTFTLSYTPGDHGSISGSSSQTVDYGSDGSVVTAVADTGYHFVRWSDGDTAATRTDSNVTDALDRRRASRSTPSRSLPTPSAWSHLAVWVASIDYGAGPASRSPPTATLSHRRRGGRRHFLGAVTSHVFSDVTGGHDRRELPPTDPLAHQCEGLPHGWVRVT